MAQCHLGRTDMYITRVKQNGKTDANDGFYTVSQKKQAKLFLL